MEDGKDWWLCKAYDAMSGNTVLDMNYRLIALVALDLNMIYEYFHGPKTNLFLSFDQMT